MGTTMRLGILAACATLASAGTFTVENDQFVRDGKVMQIFAGSFHYSRQPAPLWNDTLVRMKALGLNTVQFYVPWNWHEYNEGKFNWAGDHDLPAFLRAIQDNGMYAMVRQGPYICGEWEFGGFPAWLLSKNVTIRTMEPNYIKYVDLWFAELQAKLKPFLYANGGPVIMVQIENEYGSYGNVAHNPKDLQYMEHLRDITNAAFDSKALIYTTDGGSTGFMTKGTIKGGSVVTLGDHGPGDFRASCNAQAHYNAEGKNPCMDTEFYTGWLTHWGENMANTSAAAVANSLDTAASKGYSFALYMAFGGSNFGWMAGANGGGASFQPDITSYDYDSPIQENGDHGYGPDGDKFEAVRNVLKKYNPDIIDDIPPRARTAYGKVTLTQRVAMLDDAAVDALTRSEGARVPLGAGLQTMEMFGQLQGYIMYSTTAPVAGDKLVISPYPRDRAIVFVDGRRVPGAIYRPQGGQALTGLKAAAGSKIDILVEDMGRLNFGGGMTDPKGLDAATKVTLDGTALAGWARTSYHCDTDDVAKLPFTDFDCADATTAPAFYKGTLQVTGAPTDTYLRVDGFEKGMVWVNGFNLGRYWESKGPQHALFVPGCKLREGANDVVVLELEHTSKTCAVAFTVSADFSGQPLPKCADAPAEGTVLTTNRCEEAAFGPLQDFTLSDTNGGVTVSVAGMCVTVGPTNDPSSGHPSATVQACDGRASQTFTYDASKQTLQAQDGTCMDITDNSKGNLANIEFYPCNGGPNQKWKVVETPLHAHQLVTPLDSYCATACMVA